MDPKFKLSAELLVDCGEEPSGGRVIFCDEGNSCAISNPVCAVWSAAKAGVTAEASIATINKALRDATRTLDITK